MRGRAWAPLGAVVLAAASSACCWLPLLAVGAGIGAGGAAVLLERYRWFLFGAAALLIGLGFYLNYRRDTICAPDGSCPPGARRLRTTNLVVLWICAAFVIVFALFPQILTAVPSAPRASAARAVRPSNTLVLDAGGMTCADCKAPVSPSARRPPAVTRLTSDVHELREAFNRDTGSVRILALLSPT